MINKHDINYLIQVSTFAEILDLSAKQTYDHLEENQVEILSIDKLKFIDLRSLPNEILDDYKTKLRGVTKRKKKSNFRTVASFRSSYDLVLKFDNDPKIPERFRTKNLKERTSLIQLVYGFVIDFQDEIDIPTRFRRGQVNIDISMLSILPIFNGMPYFLDGFAHEIPIADIWKEQGVPVNDTLLAGIYGLVHQARYKTIRSFRALDDGTVQQIQRETSVEEKFDNLLRNWSITVDTMFQNIKDTAQVWRFLLMRPVLPKEEIDSATLCPDFLDYTDYLIYRRDEVNCNDNELGHLAMLHTAFQKTVEQKIKARSA